MLEIQTDADHYRADEDAAEIERMEQSKADKAANKH